VNRVISRDINKVAVDQVIYCCWCDPEGKVIDDGTITRLGENEYRWTAADPSLRWFQQNALGLEVAIEDISEQTAALALMGRDTSAITTFTDEYAGDPEVLAMRERITVVEDGEVGGPTPVEVRLRDGRVLRTAHDVSTPESPDPPSLPPPPVPGGALPAPPGSVAPPAIDAPWFQQLRSEVQPTTYKKGREYAEARRVTIGTVQGGKVTAQVAGASGGSYEVELAWTIVPALIVVALFLATARVIASVQHPPKPKDALDVVVIGHQYWWEYRYPKFGVVSANELHVPVSDPAHPTPTFLTLLSADTDHSFWVPRLAGKTDLIPNHPNSMWIDPRETGLYLGQCAQYCGTQHAKMLLRVYVDSREDFDRWIEAQRRPARADAAVARGRQVFETTACVNCHAVGSTNANGRFGPDLSHFMSRDTLAAGAAPNTPENLRLWLRNPGAIKPGSLMPAMQLSDEDVNAVADYLESLR